MSSNNDANSVPMERPFSNSESEGIKDCNEINKDTVDIETSPSGSRKRKYELEQPICRDSTVKIVPSECTIKKRYDAAQEEVHKLRHQLHSFKEILEDMKIEMNELSQDILQLNNNLPQQN